TGIVAVIALGSGVDAVRPDAGLCEVQIDLHDPPLAPEMLDEEREPGLDSLTRIAAALPQKGVLCGLLADRGAAPDSSSGRVSLHCIFNSFEVEAVMGTELAVLRGD